MLNNFFQSAEIRWFWPGHAQWEVLLAWFTRQGRLPLVAETRQNVSQPDVGRLVKQERPHTDDYRLLPNCQTVGVKQREGRLEVKALVAVASTNRFWPVGICKNTHNTLPLLGSHHSKTAIRNMNKTAAVWRIGSTVYGKKAIIFPLILTKEVM
jgi:hypothetical protein